MKHHFGDFLDRSGGYWTIAPNRERWANHFEDVNDAPPETSIITIQKNDKNWPRIQELTDLRELTLHEPSKDQLSSIEKLSNLTSLRITHARPKDLDFLRQLHHLRELVLEYVSGFEHLDPLGDLVELRALHLENLRRVKNYSGLSSSKSLHYLSIDGTFDWKQPIEDMSFLRPLENLEYLRLNNVRVLADTPVLDALVPLKNLKYLNIPMYTLPLEDFAFIEAARSDIEGAVRPAYVVNDANRRPVSKEDIRSRMPESEFLEQRTGFVADDGARYINEPMTAFLLGKGTRTLTGAPEKIRKNCDLHESKYRELVRQFREAI